MTNMKMESNIRAKVYFNNNNNNNNNIYICALFSQIPKGCNSQDLIKDMYINFFITNFRILEIVDWVVDTTNTNELTTFSPIIIKVIVRKMCP